MGFFVAQILTGLADAGALFMVASGLSLIFGVTRIVNFAHGSFYMLGAYVGISLMEVLPGAVGFWGAILLAGVIVGLVGVVGEMLVLRPVYRAPELFQLVATFGVILVIQDLALMIWGPEDLLGPRAPGLRGVVRILGEPVPQYDLALIAITPVVALGLWFLIARTRVGVLVRAATQDREMVGALGVDQAWLFTTVFFLGTALAGLSGALQLPKGGADLLMDFNILTAVFVVVVIGGMGSLPGAYLAAVLISVLGVFGVTSWRAVAGRAQSVAEGRVRGVAHSEDAARAERQREPVEGRRGRRPRGGPDVDEPVVAPGDVAPLEGERPDELREGQRQHGEVDAREAQADPADRHRRGARRERREQQRRLHPRVGVGHEQRRGVGAAAEEGRVPEAHEPAEAEEEVQARREEREDEHVGREHLREGRAVERQRGQQGEERGDGEAHARPGGADRALGLADLAVLARDLLAPEEPEGAHDEHRDHDDEGQHQRGLRQVGGHGHPREALPVGGLLARGRHGGARGRALRVLKGQRVPQRAGDRALVRRADRGVPRRREDAFGRGRGRRGLRVGRGRADALPVLAPDAGPAHHCRGDRGARGHRRRPAPPRGAFGPHARAGGGVSPPEPPVLEARGLSNSFGGVRAVDGIDLAVGRGELLALIGPNGAGKSTCFNMLMGQLRPSSGSVLLMGEDVTGLPPRAIWRRGVGRTFQVTAAYASMTVAENVQMALISHRGQVFALLPRAHRLHRAEALALLDLVGMADQADRPCAVLAYGDLKRLELAIALAHDPALLLMDEPTAGMAPRERADLMHLTAGVVRDRGTAVLFTEHDMGVVFGHAHRIVVMNRGRLIAQGDAEAIRADPKVREVYLGGGAPSSSAADA